MQYINLININILAAVDETVKIARVRKPGSDLYRMTTASRRWREGEGVTSHQ